MFQAEWFIVFILFTAAYATLCYFIARYFENNSALSFGWLYFFLFFGGLILGSIVISVSPKKGQQSTSSLELSRSAGIGLTALSCVFAAVSLWGNNINWFYTFGMASIFLFGSGIYWVNKIRERKGQPPFTASLTMGMFAVVAFVILTVYAWATILK